MNQSLNAMFYQGRQVRIDYVNPSTAIACGDVVILQDQIGICTSPGGIAATGAVGSRGALAIEGIFRLKKATNSYAAKFDTVRGQVWWDTSAKLAYNAPGANRVFAGLVVEPALMAEDNVKCDINKLPTQTVMATDNYLTSTTTSTSTTS